MVTGSPLREKDFLSAPGIPTPLYSPVRAQATASAFGACHIAMRQRAKVRMSKTSHTDYCEPKGGRAGCRGTGGFFKATL